MGARVASSSSFRIRPTTWYIDSTRWKYKEHTRRVVMGLLNARIHFGEHKLKSHIIYDILVLIHTPPPNLAALSFTHTHTQVKFWNILAARLELEKLNWNWCLCGFNAEDSWKGAHQVGGYSTANISENGMFRLKFSIDYYYYLFRSLSSA